MLTVAVIGYGAVGSVFSAFFLSHPSYELTCVITRSKPVRIIDRITFSQDLNDCIAADIIVIAVQDQHIEGVCQSLCLMPWVGQRYCFHFSGKENSAILSSLRQHGFKIGALHPIYNFTQTEKDKAAIQGKPCAFEGDQELFNALTPLLTHMNLLTFCFDGQYKNLYHAACTMALSFPAFLTHMVGDCLKTCGVEAQQANRIASMMIKQASEALLDDQGELLYVGPISRNEKDTMLAHHRAINDDNIKTAYKAIEHYASSINNNLNDKG